MTMADILSAVNDARTLLANDEFDGAERILAMLAGDLEYMEWHRVRRGPMLDMALDLGIIYLTTPKGTSSLGK